MGFSQWFLLVGRALTGIGFWMRSELSRSFPPDVLPQKLSLISTSYAFGFLAGTVLDKLLKVDFQMVWLVVDDVMCDKIGSW